VEKILLTLVDQVSKLTTQMEGMQHQMEGMQLQMEGMQHRMDSMQCQMNGMQSDMRVMNHRIANLETITTHIREDLNQVHKNTVAIKYELNTVTASITARLDQHARDIYDKPQDN